jgi:hypothetical protein
MQQVAEALKALQVDGKWKAEVHGHVEAIVKECEEEDFSMFESEVFVVLNAIISIYSKKAPVIQWHDRTNDSEFDPNERYEWEHDVTGEVYRQSVTVEGLHPECTNKWADGIYGGYGFDSNGTEFKTTEGVRGIGYKALIAFDCKGVGIVFF